jgi:hypothetical protein
LVSVKSLRVSFFSDQFSLLGICEFGLGALIQTERFWAVAKTCDKVTCDKVSANDGNEIFFL